MLRTLAMGLLAALAMLAPAGAVACPICGQPTVTLAEQYARSDVALLVSWVSAKPSERDAPGSATYEIVEVPRGANDELKKGARLTLEGYRGGKPGNLYLLFGTKGADGKLRWDEIPREVTETAYQYVVQAPSPESPVEKRLRYFLRFLEFPDVTIANDAHAEFVNAPTKAIAASARLLPRDKVRKWLFDPATPINRIAAYGLMLGFCGDPDDARLLERKIADADDDRRIGIEGIMFGYLLLAGDEGLAFLEKTKLSGSAPEGEIFPTLQAIRYFWSYGNGSIRPERLRSAMRLLLDNPTFAETAIVDLARWKDWSLQERLMELYGTPGYDDKAIRKAIIGYFIASTKDVPKDAADELPEHARRGKTFLDRLRARDRDLVAETERFFYFK